MKTAHIATRIARPFGTWGTWLAVGAAWLAFSEPLAQGAELATQVRRPAALALAHDGAALYVANGRSGSVSIIDCASGSVVAEHQVGQRLSDLAVVPDGAHLLALDEAADALLLLERHGISIRLAARCAVGRGPVSLTVAPDGGSCVVASAWARQLTVIDLKAETGVLKNARTIELSFSPRLTAYAREGAKLIAADAFAGKLAVVDMPRGAVESVRSIPAHNIRGLVVTSDGETLVVAHQTLNRAARTDFEDVHWGVLLNSHLRSLRIDALLGARSDAEVLRGSCMVNIGTSGNGAGDPAALAPDGAGGMVVALSGVDEVALCRSPTGHFRRFPVGAQPRAVAVDASARRIYVADSLSDTISVLEASTGRALRTISLGPSPKPSVVDLGERLFYDARLSHDNWMSCHTCHTDGHSNGQLADTLGDDSYGAPKRVPSLLGTAATGPWSWTGQSENLELQIRKSIEKTLRGRTPSDEQLEALTAYVRSLESPRPARGRNDAVARGHAVFRSLGCASCHAAPTYTSKGRYDVGLADEAGNSQFNPPSLRGVGAREPLLHDGRAANLEEVFVKHKHPQDLELSPAQVGDLVAFLKSL
jgi:YVTN family beta-propeller protein